MSKLAMNVDPHGRRRTVTNSIETGVRESVVLVPVGKIARLGKVGRRQAIVERRIMDRVHVHEIEYLASTVRSRR